MFKKLKSKFKLKREKMTILVIGLNNSGKTTIVNHFKKPREQVPISIPTVGFTIEQFKSYGVNFKVIDMSGARRYRNLWEHQFKTCQGVFFVIDSSDTMRLVVVKDELSMILNHPDIIHRAIPILFFGNKMDCQHSLSCNKLAAALNLENITDKPWHISSSNAVSGDGLEEGLQWMIHQIRILNLDHNEKKNTSIYLTSK